MTQDGGDFRVRSLTTSVYLPNFLFAVGQGAVIPFVALLALDLGATPAIAGAIVALRGVGLMIFDIPAGVMVARIGERKSMLLSTIALTLIAVVIGLRPPLPVYALLVTAMGCAWSVWTLARLAFATEVAPSRHRGRVMSMIGGVTRMGNFIGPLVSGLIVLRLGVAAPFVVQAVLALAAAAALWISPVPPGFESAHEAAEQPRMRQVLRENRRVFATAGMFALTSQVLRSAREAIIPLWGNEIGVTPSVISFIFGASSAIEILVFYPVGQLMDRRGRKWAAIPSMTLLAVGITLVPLTSTAWSLTVVGLVMGLANGLGAGMNMTIGSDLSPPLGRNQFLGLWRFTSDVGTAGGPLLVALTTFAFSLSAAAVAVGGVGAIGVLILWLTVPETLTPQHAPRQE
jgi:MFS family permease